MWSEKREKGNNDDNEMISVNEKIDMGDKNSDLLISDKNVSNTNES